MKKFTGRYTTNTAKALKGSERILCQVSEDGTIYICNGFLLCTMNAPEYAATVQPLTCCEPGAWTFDKDGKHEDEAHKLGLVGRVDVRPGRQARGRGAQARSGQAVRRYRPRHRRRRAAGPRPVHGPGEEGPRRLLLQRRRRFRRDL